jgi:hypothetical protein
MPRNAVQAREEEKEKKKRRTRASQLNKESHSAIDIPMQCAEAADKELGDVSLSSRRHFAVSS